MTKRVICTMLALVMLMIGSCGKTGTGTGADTVNELRSQICAQSENISVNGAVATYFFNDHYNAFTTSMSSTREKYGFDESKPLGEQYYSEGKDWLTYFTDSMRIYLSHYVALCESAKVNGITLTEEEITALEARAERGVKGKYGEKLSSDDILEAIKLEALANKLTVIKKAELMPDESKMRQYAETKMNNYSYPEGATVNVYHVMFSSETNGSPEAALAKANEIVSQMTEVTAESIALLALEFSDDASTCYSGGAYRNLAKGASEAAFDEWCFDEMRAPGDVEIIETEHGAHIMYYAGEGLSKWQGEISEKMVDEEFAAICDLLYAHYPVTFNEETVSMIAK